MRNDWETDSFGDPLQTGGNPWTAAPGATPDITQPDLTSGGSAWMTPAPADALSTSTQTSAAPDTYDAHLTTLAQAGDPASRASAQDGLARQLQSDLEADGHAIKWSGATALTIDGRQYELGDGSAGGDGGYTPPDPPPYVPTPTPAPAGSAPVAGTPGGPIATNPDGSQVGSGLPWDPTTGAPIGTVPGYHWDPKYAAWMHDTNAPDLAPARPSGGQLTDQQFAAQFVAWAATQPGVNPSVKTDPNYWIGRFTSGAFGNDQDYALTRMMQAEGPPEGAGGAAQTSPWLSNTQPRATTSYPAWSPTAPTYTPNFIDTSASELPGYDDIMKALSTPGAGDAELQKLVQGIVEHPETLSDQDVERLKAQSAEEAAVAGQAQDEELQHFGYSAGLDSSPWLAGQRAQNAWDRRSSTIGANRNIDIAAADRRSADRQSAAQIGTAYSSFQSSKKAQAVGLAVSAALGKAGEQRSRTQLNESLKQAATQLGLTKDNLVMTYLSHAMDDLTRNKQIDLNFDVDMKKLAEQSDEFKQTLLQRIAEMSQQDNQFAANYGLAVQEFQHKKDTDAWDRAKSTVGT